MCELYKKHDCEIIKIEKEEESEVVNIIIISSNKQ